ncbi:MAG: BrnT family toxin [Gammaproteobacteria bacterium]
MAVFEDPLALSRHDDDHGRAEERWVTLGQSDDSVLVVVHTFQQCDEHVVEIRIISARHPTATERRQYETDRYRIQEATMKSEYDFSEAKRGRFYREGARLISPVHLAADVVARLSDFAAAKGMSATDLANEILRRAIAELDDASRT